MYMLLSALGIPLVVFFIVSDPLLMVNWNIVNARDNPAAVGNITSAGELIADGKKVSLENLTISSAGNVTITGNLTITDDKGNVLPLEELLFSGNLTIGCRRCHELNNTS